MIKEIHDHMTQELQQNARTDTVFVLSAVVLNLVILAINWGVASPGPEGYAPYQDIILSLLTAAVLIINFLIAKALLAGRDMRLKLLTGLIRMYKDNGVDKYYEPSLLSAYSMRYKFFLTVIIILAVITITAPLMVRIFS
ncbi:MAG TPA: hypothetical protein VJ203_01755 [Bacteroidales bacterium]|nr:hypothetical protein [Bacteroidales bacterium]